MPSPVNPVPPPDGAPDKAGLWLDRAMEWGIYALVFALFNPHSTAIRSLGLYLPMLAWLVSLARGRERETLRTLRQPLGLLFFGFVGLVLLSCVQAPDVMRSLSSFRKDFADVLLVAPPIAAAFRDPARRARLFGFIAFNGCLFALLDTFQYAMELWKHGKIPDDILLHRFYADGLIFFIPFSLAQAVRHHHGWKARCWWLLAVWQVLLLFGTGARGAWLGFGISMLVWFALEGRRRAALWMALGTAAAGGIALVALPHDLVLDRLRQGMDTTYRTTGTWGPALEMIAEEPWLGHGFGKEVFHEAFNRRAPHSPWWTIKESMGPHSSYLEIGFAAGLPAFVLMVFLYARLFGDAVRGLVRRANEAAELRQMLVASASAFVALPLTRGFVESVPWLPLGLLVGIVLACVAHSSQAGQCEGRGHR